MNFIDMDISEIEHRITSMSKEEQVIAANRLCAAINDMAMEMLTNSDTIWDKYHKPINKI